MAKQLPKKEICLSEAITNYFLPWPAKQPCFWPNEGSNQMALQGGPKSPSAISRRGGESDSKNMPDRQVTDNRIISNLVGKPIKAGFKLTII